MPTRFPGSAGSLAARALPGLLLLVVAVLLVLLLPGDDPGAGPREAEAAGAGSRPEAGSLDDAGTGTAGGGADAEVQRSDVATDPSAESPAAAAASAATALQLQLRDGRDAGPAAGVRVTAHDMQGGWPYPLLAEGTSEEDGRLLLEVTPGRVLSLRIHESQELQYSRLRVEPLAAGELRAIEIGLQPHLHTAVRVRAVSTEGGTPVAGAYLEPFGDETAFSPRTTGADGIALLDDVRESAWGPLRAVADGYAWTFVMVDPDAADLVVEMTPEARISGIVLRADGTPAPGAWLEIRDDPQRSRIYADDALAAWYAAADDGGRYTLGGLPPRTPLVVAAHLDGQIARFVVPGLVAGEQQLDVQLGAPPVLHGRVTTQFGEPLAGIGVEAQAELGAPGRPAPLATFERRTAVSDAEGRFRFEGKGMAPGLWKVGTAGALDRQALRPDATRGATYAWLPALESVEIPAGAESAEVHLVLSRGLFIEGRFLAPDGAPMSGGVVRAYPHEGTEGPRVETLEFDEQGGFRVGPLAPGTYLVRATDAVTTAFAEAHDVEAGTQGLVLRGKLPRGVRGRVVDPDGRPAQARLYAFDRKHVESVMWALTVDGEGRFSLFDDDVELLDFIAFRADGLAATASGVRLTVGGQTEVLMRLEPAARVSIAVRGIEGDSWYSVARLRGQVICEGDPFFLESLEWLPEGLLQLQVFDGQRELAATERRLVLGDAVAQVELRVPPQPADDE